MGHIKLIVLGVIVAIAAFLGVYYAFVYSVQTSIVAIINNNTSVALIGNVVTGTTYTVTSTPALPTGYTVIQPSASVKSIQINGLTANTLYTFSVAGFSKSNAIFTGSGSLGTPVPLLTKVSATSITVSCPAITNATSYQIIVTTSPTIGGTFVNYKSTSQSTSTISYTNVPAGIYKAMIQASCATGTILALATPTYITLP